METTQLNLRIPKELVNNLKIIENVLKVNKSEWIKTKIAENVNDEINKLLMEVSTKYAKGLIDKNEVERLVGKNIADEMELLKRSATESARKGRELGKKLRDKA